MKTCKKLYHLSVAVAIVSMFVIVLVSCSSSGDEAGVAAGGSLSSATISGVAAAGAPIIGNAYLKDSANHVIGPEPIGADGSFSFNVTGLRPPFYLLAVGHVGSTDYLLYSVTTSSSGIANINPLTNVIVAAAAGDIDPASVYGDPAAHPVTNEELDTAITNLQTILGPILAANNAQNLNPISSPFVANNTQLDKVLDQITVVVTTSGGTTTVTVTNSFTGAVIAQAPTESLGTTPPVSTTDIPFIGTIISGANNLLLNQDTDGGYYWPSKTTDTVSTNHPNTISVTAQGVLDAYKVTQNSTYFNSCVKTYNLLVFNSTQTTRLNGYTRNNIRGADIYFLVDLSNVTGDPKYATFAKTWYQATVANPNFGNGSAAGIATWVLTGWSGGAGSSWDINIYVRGLLTLNNYFPGQGFDADAAAMTEVIYNSLYSGAPPIIDISNASQMDYYLGLTGAIEAFTTTGLHLDKRDALLSVLLASQLTTQGTNTGIGEFLAEKDPVSDIETTAYAIMVLLKINSSDSNVITAIQNAMKFLVNRQLPDGSLLETDGKEYTETESEAIQAIYNFQK